MLDFAGTRQRRTHVGSRNRACNRRLRNGLRSTQSPATCGRGLKRATGNTARCGPPSPATCGQRLFFNQNGERASLTGQRKSDFLAEVDDEGDATLEVDQVDREGLNMVLLIQVPLKQKEPMVFGGGGDTMVDYCCAPEGRNSHQRPGISTTSPGLRAVCQSLTVSSRRSGTGAPTMGQRCR